MAYLPDIKSFQECLDIANEAKGDKNLLLGNGFSMDLFPDIFNYKTLADNVTSKRIKSLFEGLGTNDFEYIMRKLTDAIEIAEHYPPEGVALNVRIRQDLDELKKTLIEVIHQSHPEIPQAITDVQYDHCHAFLKNFNDGKKYSLNYDLLLYWVHMHFISTEKVLKCNDGFRYPEDNKSILTWEIGREYEQNLYYLHGALHIFSNGPIIEKYTSVNNDKTIINQVSDSISNRKYPLFISEGTKKHKQERILGNSYLGRVFSSLKVIEGNLFVFGHSIRDEDDHIFDCINKSSRVKNIFISIFGNSERDSNQKIFEKVENWRKQFDTREYYYYHSDSANVWGKQSAFPAIDVSNEVL